MASSIDNMHYFQNTFYKRNSIETEGYCIGIDKIQMMTLLKVGIKEENICVDVVVVNRCKRFTLDSTLMKLVQTMINSWTPKFHVDVGNQLILKISINIDRS